MSNYSIVIPYDTGALFFNSFTKQLLYIENEWQNSIHFVPFLLNKNIVVPKAFDEKNIVKELYDTFRCKNTSDCVSAYTILTTTSCNAQCPYCYESSCEQKTMSKSVADDLLKHILLFPSHQPLALRWFGGEPLLNSKIIKHICLELKKNNIDFYSEMVTNGLLFNEKTLTKTVLGMNLTHVQITIDDIYENYSQIKNISCTKLREPFNHVVNIINLLASESVYVNVRLNVFKENYARIDLIIDELKKIIIDSDFININAHAIFDHVRGVRQELHNFEKINQAVIVANSKLFEMGLFKPTLKRRHGNGTCIADDPHSIVVLPDGHFSVCEHYLDDHFIGEVGDRCLNREILSEFNTRIFTEECIKCPGLFSCNRLLGCDARIRIPNELQCKTIIDIGKYAIINEYKKYKGCANNAN